MDGHITPEKVNKMSDLISTALWKKKLIKLDRIFSDPNGYVFTIFDT